MHPAAGLQADLLPPGRQTALSGRSQRLAPSSKTSTFGAGGVFLGWQQGARTRNKAKSRVTASVPRQGRSKGEGSGIEGAAWGGRKGSKSEEESSHWRDAFEERSQPG